MPYHDSDIWASPKESAKLTKVPLPTIYYWLQKRKIPGAAQIGARYLVPRKWIEDFRGVVQGTSDSQLARLLVITPGPRDIADECPCEHQDGNGYCLTRGQQSLRFDPPLAPYRYAETPVSRCRSSAPGEIDLADENRAALISDVSCALAEGGRTR